MLINDRKSRSSQIAIILGSVMIEKTNALAEPKGFHVDLFSLQNKKTLHFRYAKEIIATFAIGFGVPSPSY